MITAGQLRFLNLDFLANVVDAWQKLANQAGAHVDDHAARVLNPLAGNWQGKDADKAVKMLHFFADDMRAIRTEAGAGVSILRKAYDELTRAKNDLAAVFEEAARDGLTIDDNGAVQWPATETEQQAAHKKDLAQGLATRVTDILHRASDADFLAARELRANTDTGPKPDFNSRAVGADPVGESIRAADLTAKLHEGGLSAEEAEELRVILAQNQANPAFAVDFARREGPDGLMDATLDLARWSDDAGDHNGKNDPRIADFQKIQQGLGVTLATASPTLYQDKTWMAALTKAAEQERSIPLVQGRVTTHTTLYGYQMLSVLMQNGRYDPEFTKSVTTDMLDFERKNGRPPIWKNSVDPPPPFSLNITGSRGSGLDPVTGMMTALSRDPQAATEFFSGDNRGNVDYLLDQRKYVETGKGNPALAAVGQALDSATTGPTTPAKVDILQNTVHTLTRADGGPGVAPELRNSVTDMLAHNAETLHAATTGERDMVSNPANVADIDTGEMQRALGDIGQGPDARANIEKLRLTEEGYAAYRMNEVDDHTASADNRTRIEKIAHQSGQVAGALDSAINQGVKDAQEADDQAENADTAHNANAMGNGAWAAAGAVSATPAGPFAAVGAAGINYAVSEWVAGNQQDTSGDARAQIGNNYGTDLNRAQDTVNNWLTARNAQPGRERIDPTVFDPNMGDAFASGQSHEAGSDGRLPR